MGKVYLYDMTGTYCGAAEVEDGTWPLRSLQQAPEGDLLPSQVWRAVGGQWVASAPVVMPPPPPPDSNIAALANLAAIDLNSIRSMREWIAKQPGAPQFLKDFEAKAVEEREKIVTEKQL